MSSEFDLSLFWLVVESEESLRWWWFVSNFVVFVAFVAFVVTVSRISKAAFLLLDFEKG